MKKNKETVKLSPEAQIAALKVANIKRTYQLVIAVVGLVGVVGGGALGFLGGVHVITDAQSRASDVVTSAVLKERQ